ncbi:MAG: hypothetical protein JXB32_07130 [Deltaproteobacteria bacterium]|nr:hypothetical protein [Deltaproteobacteria bacterium]
MPGAAGLGLAAWGAALLGAGCPIPPGVPGGPVMMCPAVTADADGLLWVDLQGIAETRPLLLGGGWRGAAWVGRSQHVALDRELDGERSLSVLDLENGRLYPAGLPSLEALALEPAVLDALVGAFGDEAAFPEDRLVFGALRVGPGGRPAVELIARAGLPGEEESPDVLVRLEPLVLAGPVERALAAAPEGAADEPRWVFRSPHGVAVLGGGTADDWSCRRFAGEEAAAAAGPEETAGVVGRTTAAGEAPLTVAVPRVGDVTLPGSAPVDGYERCDSPDGRWLAVRVEQPGLNGFDALYVVRAADGSVVRAAHYDIGELTAAGVAAAGSGLLVYGGAEGWFLWRAEGDPERLGDFPPVLRP